MSDDYTYLPPGGDMEYAYDAPPVELVRPSELSALRAALAAVPWDAISFIVWMLDDGPYDQEAVDAVVRWLDTRPGLAEQRNRDIEARVNAQQSEAQP